ncbi:expressed unknown protein [Seminavis robusta]|uniref:Uncharacterized protein n=1 Tax=Seminavis robusta TaxID=568900 RepID=A0A9N8E649_9STRA|nr:expressed unknown protein [Seminavis robusta]|eukprot:Sro589_g171720.1 n/a (534) ;mRNA; f:21197-22798
MMDDSTGRSTSLRERRRTTPPAQEDLELDGDNAPTEDETSSSPILYVVFLLIVLASLCGMVVTTTASNLDWDEDEVASDLGSHLKRSVVSSDDPTDDTISYPNVFIVGAADAVSVIASYAMRLEKVCGPDNGRPDRGDPLLERIPGSHFLYDWELTLKEEQSENRSFTEDDLLGWYLQLYQHCSLDTSVRLDATWAHINHPNTVRHVLDLISARRQRQQQRIHNNNDKKNVSVKIVMVMPARAIDQIRNQTDNGGPNGGPDPSLNFVDCLLNRNWENQVSIGFISTKRPACSHLLSRWSQLLGKDDRMFLVPCEFIRQNQTGFLNQYHSFLGLENGKRKHQTPNSTVQPPLDLEWFVNSSSNNNNNGIQSLKTTYTWLLGTYSNDTMTQEDACTPRVTHHISGNRSYNDVAINIDNSNDSKNRTFQLFKRQELLLVDPDRVVESSLSGYWYLQYFVNNQQRDYQRPAPYEAAIRLQFDATTTEGIYNIQGGNHGHSILAIRGVLLWTGNDKYQVRIVIQELQQPNYELSEELR